MDYFSAATLEALKLIIGFDSELYIIVWTSLKISLAAVTITSLICMPLGLLIAHKSFFGKQLLQSILNTLMALPTVVVGLLLYGILSRQGPLGGWGILYTQTAMVIGQCVLIFPIILNLVIAAVNSADPRIRTTCMALGASNFQQGVIFFNEIRFAVMAAIFAGFGRAIGEVGIAMMVGGNIQGYTRTMTTAIALETSKGEFEFGLALGVLLLIVAFIVNGLLQKFQGLNQ